MTDIDPTSSGYPTDDDAALGAGLGASSMPLDSNADGYTDGIAIFNDDGTTDVHTDQNQNGLIDGAVAFRADGTVAAVFQDLDENGAFETVGVDQTGNGVLDTLVVDTDGNGVLDTTVVDLNENGVADVQEVPATAMPGSGTALVGGHEPLVLHPVPAGTTGPGVIGPVTNPDPVYSLIVRIAGETGQAVFPPDDSDHDGWDDTVDNHPDDQWRH